MAPKDARPDGPTAAKPQQDMRIDLPAIDFQTMRGSQARVLTVQYRKTAPLHGAEVIDLAENPGAAMVSLNAGESRPPWSRTRRKLPIDVEVNQQPARAR